MHVSKDVYVPMRDGVCMALDVYRPEGPGRFPGVVMRTPYLKDAGTSPEEEAAGALANPRARTVQTLVDAGYCVVVSDTRGTGYSEGLYDYYNFEGGPFDGYDTVEWAAEQPWCDGNVGMTGASASAILAYSAAITRPPSLRCIVANMHPADFYFDQWFVGGVFRYESRIGWCTNMLGRIEPRLPGPRESASFERKRDVYQWRYEQYRVRMSAGKNPANLDWLTEMYRRNRYDDYWKSISFVQHLDDFAVPVLHGGVWFDHFIRGTLASHERVGVPKRLFVSPGALGSAPDAGDGGFDRLQVRWFDHFLRGQDNGVLDEPGVRLYVTGAERWIDETAWPFPVTEQELFLADGARLVDAAPGTSEPDVVDHDPSSPNRTARNPADQRRFESRCLTYTTSPLEADTMVAGTPRLKLYASSDARDVDWCVRLCDVYPGGRSRLLNTGALKARHVHSHEAPSDLQPGHLYEFDIEIWPVANLFRQGHSIRVDVSTSDFPFFENNPLSSRNHVFHDVVHPSRLTIPVVAR